MEVINRRTEGEMDLAISICVCVFFEAQCGGAYVYVFCPDENRTVYEN